MEKRNTKVFVGMSGGVDSSVSAALLKKAGYDVTGVFIKVWHPDFLPCSWKEERRDAMRVCAALNIPFLTFDFEEEYKRDVVDYMLTEYKRGRTPNPDVMCNRYIKFGSFLKKAKTMGAQKIATGHYAIIEEIKEGTKKTYILKESKDKEKDQSYFLWTLGQEELSESLFPVGGYEKTEVRALAQKFNLPTFEKKDSQGLCFLGKIDLREFLSLYLPVKKGDVVNLKEEIIGIHDGVHLYTIGQRHGFTITKKSALDVPLYVIDKDAAKNRLIVSDKKEKIYETVKTKKAVFSDMHWVSGNLPSLNQNYLIRFRYHQTPIVGRLAKEGRKIVAIFETSQDSVALGQSLVLYTEDEVCLGGGIIDRVG